MRIVDAEAALANTLNVNLTATSVPGRITLTWNAVPGTMRYQVERDGTFSRPSSRRNGSQVRPSTSATSGRAPAPGFDLGAFGADIAQVGGRGDKTRQTLAWSVFPMIRLSLFRWMAGRARVLVALVALLAFAGGSCTSHTCTAIGCLEGLIVHLEGDFDASRTYELTLIEDVSGGPSTFMTCSLSFPAAVPGQFALSCSSAVEHVELGDMLQIRRNDIRNLTVVVSSSGTELGRQTFQPAYKTSEINGPGCGTCTQASVDVTVP